MGAHNEKRTSYGHSIIISPWGEVMAELGGPDKGDDWEPEIITVDIDLKSVEKVRKELPLLRRTYVPSHDDQGAISLTPHSDVYPEV